MHQSMAVFLYLCVQNGSWLEKVLCFKVPNVFFSARGSSEMAKRSSEMAKRSSEMARRSFEFTSQFLLLLNFLNSNNFLQTNLWLSLVPV